MKRAMKHLRLSLPFALLLLMACLAMPALADETRPALRTAVESAKIEAATLLQKGRAADAYELYMRLLRQAPDDDAVNLGLARSAMGAARYNQAAMAYERLLAKYPKEASLYGELANAYMALGDKPSAERALAAMRLADSGVGQEEVDKKLSALEDRYDRLQIHGKVRGGVLYDSNANLGPSSSSMTLGNWQVLAPDAKAVDTFGGYLGADINVAWRPERDTAWWLVGDAQTYVRGNTNNDLGKGRSRYSEWGRAAVGARRLTPTALFDLRVKAEIFDYEFYQNVAAIGPEATFLWAATPGLHLISRANVDQRAYSQDSKRNGVYGSAGEYVRLFFGDANHEVLFGAAYLGGAADNEDYSYNGWEGTLRATFKLPYSFEFAPFTSFAQEWYNGPATALETEDRYDERWRIGATLTYRITEAWSAEVMYQFTTNDSRSQIYEYDQNLVTLGMAWNF